VNGEVSSEGEEERFTSEKDRLELTGTQLEIGLAISDRESSENDESGNATVQDELTLTEKSNF
tara:strand:+ start:348 stop:536 length:189 start_codon:yes stop_codon:yes gene_type:complete